MGRQVAESKQLVVLLCQPQAGTIRQQDFRTLCEMHDLVSVA